MNKPKKKVKKKKEESSLYFEIGKIVGKLTKKHPKSIQPLSEALVQITNYLSKRLT